MIRDKNLLLPPRGVDPHKFFFRLNEYRERFVRWRISKEKDYSAELQKKYDSIKGEQKETIRAMEEEMTGILLKTDKAWRSSIKIDSKNKIKKFKFVTDKEIRQRQKMLQGNDQYTKG